MGDKVDNVIELGVNSIRVAPLNDIIVFCQAPRSLHAIKRLACFKIRGKFTALDFVHVIGHVKDAIDRFRVDDVQLEILATFILLL